MVGRAVKLGSLVGVALLAWTLRPRDDALLRIATRLEALEATPAAADDDDGRPRSVAVGYGACYDLFVDLGDGGDGDRPLLDAAAPRGEPRHRDRIAAEAELLESFAHYFRHGAAAERFVSNATLFDELVARAEALPSARWAVGGNAPVMAARFRAEGCRVLLAARASRRLRDGLPAGVACVPEEVAARDDVHLIVEYKADAAWGGYVAPRANRYIAHNDASNPTVSALEALGEALGGFGADLLVVSGLQMMDSYPFEEGVREARLAKIKRQMMAQPPSTLVHFEMASYVEAKLVRDLVSTILPHADSLGMNEQELANLAHALAHGDVTTVADSNPRVATTLDQMRFAFEAINAANAERADSRALTRIHVHTLAYQAILTTKGSAWRRTARAAAKASLTAHRHVCGGASVRAAQAKLVMDGSFATSADAARATRVQFDPERPVACWEESLRSREGRVVVLVCVAPVLVCTDARQTAGAGDNISAAALAVQI